MFNYDDSAGAKRRLKILFLIYSILIFAPLVYGIMTTALVFLLLIICLLPVFLLLYFALSRSPVFENRIFEFIKLFNPEDVAVYSSGFFTCVTMKKFDYFILIRDPMFRNIYVCKGVEDEVKLADKFSLAIGRIARRTKLIDYFESEGLNVRILEGEIVMPHPRYRGKVVRGRGFKVSCWRPYHPIKPSEVVSLISGISMVDVVDEYSRTFSHVFEKQTFCPLWYAYESIIYVIFVVFL